MSGHIGTTQLAAVRLAAGVNCPRTLELADATGSVAPGAGTYTLRAPDGSDVAGCAGLTVTAGAVTVPVPAGITLGPGYVEIWAMASVGGVARTITLTAVVQTWTLGTDEVLCPAYILLQRYPIVSTWMAPGQSSWDAAAIVASQRVLADADAQMSTRGGQMTTRSQLAWMAAEALAAEVHRVCGANGNAAVAQQALLHEAAYASLWERATIDVDTSGDGAADAQRTPGAPPGGSL